MMQDHRGIEIGVLISALAAINWQTAISMAVGVAAFIFYCTKIYKEWFGGESK